MRIIVGGKDMKFEVVRNDITNMQVDAIVLPANPQLKEGSGTSKRIYEKAGRKDLEKECKKYRTQKIGDAVHTLGYALDARFIIHAIVPRWNKKEDENQQLQLLSETYFSVLHLADEIGCETLALPLLASGNYGFDIDDAFIIAQKSIEAFEPNNKLEKIVLVVYNKEAMTVMRKYGISVDEVIDEEYVLKTDEKYESPIKRTLDKGKVAAEKAIKDGAKIAKEQIENPENREKMLAGIIAAAKIVSEKKNRDKIMQAVKVVKDVTVKFFPK